MNSTLRIIIGALKGNLYLLLLIVTGGMAILESMRITEKYRPKNWLSGPSGFMMLIGCALIGLLLIEIILRCAKAAKRQDKAVGKTALEKTGVDVEQEQESKKHTRNMIYSFAMLIAYTLLIKPLGFALSSSLYLSANLWLLENPVKTTIITAVAVLLFMVFGAPALGISFPRGLLGF